MFHDVPTAVWCPVVVRNHELRVTLESRALDGNNHVDRMTTITAYHIVIFYIKITNVLFLETITSIPSHINN